MNGVPRGASRVSLSRTRSSFSTLLPLVLGSLPSPQHKLIGVRIMFHSCVALRDCPKNDRFETTTSLRPKLRWLFLRLVQSSLNCLIYKVGVLNQLSERADQ